MTLRDQILNSPETLSGLAWAAEQRFGDAEQLLYADRLAGAVYLFGIASEVWLKLACFRARGASLSATVASQFGPARSWMNVNAKTIDKEGYHSLLFWAEYLIRWRSGDGNPMPRNLIGQVQHHVLNRLYQDWKIDLRYRFISLSKDQSFRVYNDALWMRGSWNLLWR